MAEFVDGFEAIKQNRALYINFGSARTKPGNNIMIWQWIYPSALLKKDLVLLPVAVARV